MRHLEIVDSTWLEYHRPQSRPLVAILHDEMVPIIELTAAIFSFLTARSTSGPFQRLARRIAPKSKTIAWNRLQLLQHCCHFYRPRDSRLVVVSWWEDMLFPFEESVRHRPKSRFDTIPSLWKLVLLKETCAPHDRDAHSIATNCIVTAIRMCVGRTRS